MPPIDYTIPGQFKGIQIESPINRMAAIEQLENARNQNALAQFQLGAAQRAETKETTRMRLLGEAGNDETAVANALLKSGDVAGYSAYVKAIEDRKTQKLTQTKTTGDIVTTRLAQSKEFLNTLSPDDPNAGAKFLAWHEANHKDEYLGPLLASRGVTAAQSRASINAAILQGPRAIAELINKSRLGIDKFTENQKAEAKELRERAEKLYPAYQLSEFGAGREPLDIDQFVAQRMQTTAAPATAAPTTVAPTTAAPEFVGAGGDVTTLPGGDKSLPPVTTSANKMPSAFGSDIHPLVPSLLAAGNNEAAKLVQEGYKTSGTLRQINDAFKELERLETDKPKNWEARSKALRDYIKTASTEGPGTKFNLGGIKLFTEKNYGEKFAGSIAEKDAALLDAAERAPEAANTANRVLSILQSGQVFTGSAANIKLQMAKFLKLGGGSDSEAIANTEVLISSLADTTLGAIKSSGLGSGQGFTDKDREFLERAKAGQITYDARSLKDLAELAHRAAEATTNKWNKRSKAIPKSAIEGTGISTEDITVSPLFKSGARSSLPAKNADGWTLELDASGNRAYVSPDRKQFKEVK